MPASPIERHLTSIRDGFKKVDAITRELGVLPEQDELEAALAKREAVVVEEIDAKARELSAAFPDWHARAQSDGVLRGLIAEAEELMRSILHMDERLSFVVRRRMDEVQGKMASLYHTSRAAYSYTSKSTLR